MITELRVVLTAWTDRLADIIAPAPRHAQVMADLLAEAEASAEVYEPLGEYPDLPPIRFGPTNVPAGVERGPLRRSTGGHPWQQVVDVADVIDGHRLIGVMCGCTTPFATGDAHALHVARLVLDVIK